MTAAQSARRVELAPNESRTVRVRQAIGLVRRARYIAVDVPLNGTNRGLVEISLASALRLLRTLRTRMGNAVLVEVADVFGTLVIGSNGPSTL
jgi:hypothetical protein